MGRTGWDPHGRDVNDPDGMNGKYGIKFNNISPCGVTKLLKRETQMRRTKTEHETLMRRELFRVIFRGSSRCAPLW